jgi:G3E family GTPase
LIESDFGVVEPKSVLGTGLFDFDKAETHPLRFKELHGAQAHVPETEEYSIRSFVYRARAPFEPQRLKSFIDKPWQGVIRTKGFFRLATRPDHVGEIRQAGTFVRTEKASAWWASIDQSV